MRDIGVTGVQTCALPIFAVARSATRYRGRAPAASGREIGAASLRAQAGLNEAHLEHRDDKLSCDQRPAHPRRRKIGRASCRERVQISVVAVSLKKIN